ncbi:alpha-L-arabinofuranosidase B [Kribbella flavida DSM 17836]|uniref:Alpha-L-arabinofuranosidase B n=1 Tax=Kribbella flavida (strain DSM 17836 / JCM 10339 / NBRC 14399) TaxID=479435 RepID=D2PUK2_KRIFD|nr:AbfB domain-containing protein [Kribbella flavida]ADB29520.1 alpha-L-arabinofuranosidase B [Kribbella flavida DSM 17836]
MSGEQPVVGAFANAPGMVTVTWDHSGDGVHWFVIELETPYTFWVADIGKRAWSVTGLDPSHTYRYRVCAVYDFDRACSEFGSVTTMPPVSGPASPPATVDAQPLPRDVCSLQAINFPGLLARHRNFAGLLTPVETDLDRADATFVVRKGLTGAAGTVSFEASNHPGHFLRHANFKVGLHKNDNSDLFRADATFKRHGGDEVVGIVSFESVNFPEHYLRHQNSELVISKHDGSDQVWLDAQWLRIPPPPKGAPPGTVSFHSVNFPGHYVRHRNSLGEISRVSSDLDRNDATFVVRPGLWRNGPFPQGVSLESRNFPGHYLRHQDFRVKLHKDDGTELFRKDATFAFVSGYGDLASKGYGTLKPVHSPHRDFYVRHQNFELWIAETDGSSLFGLDATWQPTAPLA